MKTQTKAIWFFVSLIIVSGLYHAAHADEKHHNYQKPTNNSQTGSKGTASAVASGQHNYKATKQLQWSVGSGFSGDESALSFGLGLQTGKVFWSGNISGNLFSGESNPTVGIGASGTF